MMQLPRQRFAPGLLGWTVLLGTFVAACARLTALAYQSAVNVFFWDQWDFYGPIFRRENLWAVFRYEHAPHRQGLGGVVMAVLAPLSHLDSRWDAYCIIATLALAALLAIRLGFRCGAPSPLLLAGVPLIFFNVHQYESIVGSSNLSHGAMPVLWIVIYCSAAFVQSVPLRVMASTGAVFVLIFTGFGVFMGMLGPLLFAIEALQRWRAGDRRGAGWCTAAVLGAAACWGIFAIGYRAEPAVSGFYFPYRYPLQYLVFAASLLGHFFGLIVPGTTALLTGGALGLLLCWIAFWHLRRLLRSGFDGNARSVAIFLLTAFTLLYALNTAIGRIFLGTDAPGAPRYVTLVIPGLVGLLLHFASQPRSAWAYAATTALTVALALTTPHLTAVEEGGVRWFADGKRAWKAGYLKTHDIGQANAISRFRVYPSPEIKDRLLYLEAHRLNLFSKAEPQR